MPLTPELRKRLEQLNRGPLTVRQRRRTGCPAPGSQQGAPLPGGAKPATVQAPSLHAPPHRPVTLEEAAPGEVIDTAFGSLYLVRRTYRAIVDDPEPMLAAYRGAFLEGGASWRESTLHPDIRPLLDVDPRRVMFVDIETTGLSAQPLFLIGVMNYTGSDFEHRLLLARNYAEERAVIGHFAELLHEQEAIVTYNGRCFDVPYILERATVHGLDLTFAGHHADLLFEARRRWRGGLPNCRLQTLERCLLGRVRVGDIPGDQIPQVYHDFVRTGDARFIADVLHHNELDLAAMAEVLLHIVKEE